MNNDHQGPIRRAVLRFNKMGEAVAAHTAAQIAIAKARPATRTLAEWVDVKIKTEWHTFNFFSAQLSVIYDDCDKFCSVILSDCLWRLKARRENKIIHHGQLLESAAEVANVELDYALEREAISDRLQREFAYVRADMLAAERSVNRTIGGESVK